MLRSLKNKASSVWQKRKASKTTSTSSPAEVQTSSNVLAEPEPEPEPEVEVEASIFTVPIPITAPDNNIVTENPPQRQHNPYPLPPSSVPSTVSTEPEYEQQPRRQFTYPIPPTSVPSTVSTLSNYQHNQNHSTAQEAVDEPPTPEPEPDHYTTKYVPYTDANPLKNNMFVRSTGIYGRVNPDIMGGFGDDDESIWLVDDEEETNQEHQDDSQTCLVSSTGSTSQLPLRPSAPSTLRDSETQLQQPGPVPVPSSKPAFRYQRPSFLDDDELTPNSLLAGSGSVTTDENTPSRNGKPTSQRGYAPISTSILDLTDLGVQDVDTRAARDNTELPNKRPRTMNASSFSSANPYVPLVDQQDDAIRQLEQPENELDDEFRFGQRYQRAADSADVIVTHQRTPRSTVIDDLECAVCANTKHADAFPRFSITATCSHAPNTCLDCVQLSIESDLSSKLWTEIRCPECRELLEYVDIQRYANKQTFTKYETIALRAAMSEAENFVWCTSGCGSGQIHESGSAQPIVTCLHCNHRSCFHHNVAWHETISCKEYDQLLADPENFRSRLELENEKWSEAQQAQLEADRVMAQGLLAEDQAEMRRREERALQEREQAQKAAQLARQIAARRKKEEAKSNATVSRTTKPCAGCGWAIEKNKGCSHMTCIKCRYEFCWACNQPYTRGHNNYCRGGRD